MKSRKTKKTATARKARRARKPIQTTARYVYWYGVAHPQFGLKLLTTPMDALPETVKKHYFTVSPDEMQILIAYLNSGKEYQLTGRQLLQGICDLEVRNPRKELSPRPAENPAATTGSGGTAFAAGIPIEKVPPNPPPPWG